MLHNSGKFILPKFSWADPMNRYIKLDVYPLFYLDRLILIFHNGLISHMLTQIQKRNAQS